MKLKELKIWKLNLLDLMIILAVCVFACVFVASHLQGKENDISETGSPVGTTFTYTIAIESLSETSAEMFKSGDEVYDKVSGTYMGKISNIEVSEAQGIVEGNNGDVIFAKIPGKIDVVLTIETEGTIKNGEYLANGLIRILVGNFKQIKTKYVMCSGTVSSIAK